MEAEHFRRVIQTFDEVCDLPPNEQEAALAALSGPDAEIGRGVRRLLEAERLGSGRLDPPTFAGRLAELGPPDAQADLSLSGSRIAQFEVGERIGRGGMGDVYVGVDTSLRRRVALKAIHRDQRMSESARRRFLREARMLSSLDHPNICRIYDYLRGDEEDVLVLELIRGRGLREAVDQGLSRAQTLSIAEQIADALATSHSAGIVHRDLKLSNIMLTDDGTAKVLDFGLARPAESAERGVPDAAAAHLTSSLTATEPDASINFQTATGRVAGTLSAMSPEQVEGLPASAASDMYSFGLLAQELFTGEPAYDPSLKPIELVDAARQGATREVAGIDRHLAALIRSLTARQASARPTAAAVVERLRWIRRKPIRRWRLGATLAVIALMTLGGLKYALDLRRERTVADQRRSQAEDLIGFMLGDLRTKLEPLGRLDVLDDVGDKALDYFASVPEPELSNDELLSRAQALNQIGEVRLSQNRYDEALASFEEAYASSAALAARQSQNGAFLFDRGQAEYWVGYVHWRRLEAASARHWMERYRDTSEALVQRDGARDDWLLEVAYAHHNLAVLDLEFGHLEEAEEGFAAEVEWLLDLIERSPEDLALVDDLADAYSWLGTTALRQGLLDRSQAYYRQSTAQRATLVEIEPNNAIRQFWWAQGTVFEGDIAVVRGRWEDSVQIYQRAIDGLAGLVAADPTNREWLRALATAQVAQAKPLTQVQGRALVQDQLASAVATLEELVADVPGDRLSRRPLAVAYRLSAKLQGDEGRLQSALEWISRAVEINVSLHAEAPRDLKLIGQLARSLVIAGELQQAVGDEDAARVSWNKALDILSEPAGRFRFPDLLDPQSRALAHVGRTAESEAIAMSLDDMGFRSFW